MTLEWETLASGGTAKTFTASVALTFNYSTNLAPTLPRLLTAR